MHISRHLFTTLFTILFASPILAGDVVLKFCFESTKFVAKAARDEIDNGFRFKLPEQPIFELTENKLEEKQLLALFEIITKQLANDSSGNRPFSQSYLIAVATLDKIDTKTLATATWGGWLLPGREVAFDNDTLVMETTKPKLILSSIYFLKYSNNVNNNANNETYQTKQTFNIHTFGTMQEHLNGLEGNHKGSGKYIFSLSNVEFGHSYKEMIEAIKIAGPKGKGNASEICISPKNGQNDAILPRIINTKILYSDQDFTIIGFEFAPKNMCFVKFCINDHQIVAKAAYEDIENGYRFEIEGQTIVQRPGGNVEVATSRLLYDSITKQQDEFPSDKRDFTRSYLLAMTKLLDSMDAEIETNANWKEWLLPARELKFVNNMLTIKATNHTSSCSVAFLEMADLGQKSRKLADDAFVLVPKNEFHENLLEIDQVFPGKEILLLKAAQMGESYDPIVSGVGALKHDGKKGPIDIYISASKEKYALDDIHWRKMVNHKIIYCDTNWTAIEFEVSRKPTATIKFMGTNDDGEEIELEGDVIQHEYIKQLYIQQTDIFKSNNIEFKVVSNQFAWVEKIEVNEKQEIVMQKEMGKEKCEMASVDQVTESGENSLKNPLKQWTPYEVEVGDCMEWPVVMILKPISK